MKNLIIGFLLCLLITFGVQSAQAANLDINFDNDTRITGDEGFLPDDYSGLSWNGVKFVRDEYLDGLHQSNSGNYAVYNTGQTVTITAIDSYFSTFDFTSVDLRGVGSGHAGDQNFKIYFEGYKGSDTTPSIREEVIASYKTFTGQKFDDFIGLNKLTISTQGSTDVFDMDNLKIQTPIPTPEPSSMVFGLISLAGLLGFRKK